MLIGPLIGPRLVLWPVGAGVAPSPSSFSGGVPGPREDHSVGQGASAQVDLVQKYAAGVVDAGGVQLQAAGPVSVLRRASLARGSPPLRGGAGRGGVPSVDPLGAAAAGASSGGVPRPLSEIMDSVDEPTLLAMDRQMLDLYGDVSVPEADELDATEEPF